MEEVQLGSGGPMVSRVGLGLMIFLKALVQETPVYLTGLIPLLIGAALLAYATWFAPERPQQ